MRVRVAGVAMRTTPLDWGGNLANAIAGIEEARRRRVKVVVLPELCLTGYGCEDAFYFPWVHEEALASLAKLLPYTKGMSVVVGLPVVYRRGLYNCAAMIADGKLLGFAAKQNLAGDGVHYEGRWFKAWRPGKHGRVPLNVEGLPSSCPIGDLVFEVGGVRIGIENCEDAWVANRPGRRYARHGIELLLIPNASHFAMGKQETRKRFVVDGSRQFHAGVVYANLLGNEAGPIIFDGSVLIASNGELIGQGPRLSFSDVVVTDGVIDLDANDVEQIRQVSHRAHLGKEPQLVKTQFSWPDEPAVAPAPVGGSDWEASEYKGFEELSRSEAVGLFDYWRKAGTNGFMVSLSGGADSSTAVVLARDMIKMAVAELGLDGFKAAFRHLPWMAEVQDDKDLLRRSIHTVYQVKRGNSSDETLQSARELTDELGVHFDVIEIDEVYNEMRANAEKYLGRKLTWETDDLTLQNIQARARGAQAFTIANALNLLLLPPSNMSEGAVGYVTQGGDDQGGMNPIGALLKSFILRWLLWREKQGPLAIGPIRALRLVNALAPSAELKPKEAHQTDEGELGPYSIRDRILILFACKGMRPSRILEQIAAEFSDYDTRDLHKWMRKFFRLFAQNQWKRQRSAVSFHLGDMNLDPRSWLRWPILSSGFRKELVDLDGQLSRMLSAAA